MSARPFLPVQLDPEPNPDSTSPEKELNDSSLASSDSPPLTLPVCVPKADPEDVKTSVILILLGLVGLAAATWMIVFSYKEGQQKRLRDQVHREANERVPVLLEELLREMKGLREIVKQGMVDGRESI